MDSVFICFPVAVIRTLAKNIHRREEFISLTCPDHSLSLREVRAGAQAGQELGDPN